MNPQTILYILVAFLVFDFILERTLDYLNSSYRSAKLPEELKPYYDEEKYARSQNYHKEKERLSLISSIISFVATLVLLLTGAFGWWSNFLEQYITDPIWLALAFFATLALISGIVGLPFGLYGTFVIEEKYGFNKTTARIFIVDLVKGLLLSVVIGGLIGFLLLWLIIHLRENFWIWAWIAITAFSIIANFFYTSLILPLFNKLKPLPEDELKADIEAYAERVKFPLGKIYIMDGSKRSTKANAFFSGFGAKKTIVLFDTLIEKHTRPELIAVLAHEVGHFKKKHILKSLLIGILQTGVMFWLLSKFIFIPQLSEALGATGWKLHLNLMTIGMLFGPLSTITGIAMNMYSRKNEFEADEFAVTTADGEAFKQALIRLSTDTLSNLKPHPAYVFVHYSHPPLLERLKKIEKEKVKESGF